MIISRLKAKICGTGQVTFDGEGFRYKIYILKGSAT